MKTIHHNFTYLSTKEVSSTQKIGFKKRFWLLLIASLYLLGGMPTILLEGMHEFSHMLSHVKSHDHHHQLDHALNKEHSHHHEVIDFLAALFPSKNTAHKNKDTLEINPIDKHFSPQYSTLHIAPWEPKKTFPFYIDSLFHRYLKVLLPPPKNRFHILS